MPRRLHAVCWLPSKGFDDPRFRSQTLRGAEVRFRVKSGKVRDEHKTSGLPGKRTFEGRAAARLPGMPLERKAALHETFATRRPEHFQDTWNPVFYR